MLKYLSFLIVILLAAACTLSAEQENRLNKQLSKYIKSYNTNNTLEYAGLTHPAVVRYYTSLGDSQFIQHFSNPNQQASNLDNPLFREMKSEGKWIERKYTIRKESDKESDNSYELYAISSDGGNNWFFLTEEDYFLKKIPLKKRLFSK
ncbi:MAG: hypothetical protein K0S23_1435 [Fluviicola sp.]|uniref:hypothetical protein n=1 Tax=Fluviicola sp. TaxID=1917219 RepID=UPI00261D9B6D|nr:hypothetical protein [Fluviicola sp.]MDF3027128.1 hypothetical protein [Fluviicola sp.]